MSIEKEIYTISRLNKAVKNLLEKTFLSIWVEGEISNLTLAISGHLYFSLKDDKASVRSAMFKGRAMNVKFKPENGMHVLCKARISLYEPRGEYQLIIDYMEQAGEGVLQRAFEQLKQKLFNDGLFNQEYKKPLPAFPNAIGVITSATGAAVQDVLHVLKRRFPALPVFIYPTLVQGKEAAPQIVKAIELANKDKRCEVLLLVRGGGSLEDLWPFNEEPVARAVFNSAIPIVSGVGHEVDVTIVDFIADYRAPTPSAAAEIASPNQTDLLNYINKIQYRLAQFIQQQLKNYYQQIIFLQKQLQHPKQRLEYSKQRMDELVMRLMQHHKINYQAKQHQLALLNTELSNVNPQKKIKALKQHVNYIEHSLIRITQTNLIKKNHYYQQLAHRLDAISPLATLKRGYSVITDARTQKLITSNKQVYREQQVNIRLSEGFIVAQVIDIH